MMIHGRAPQGRSAMTQKKDRHHRRQSRPPTASASQSASLLAAVTSQLLPSLALVAMIPMDATQNHNVMKQALQVKQRRSMSTHQKSRGTSTRLKPPPPVLHLKEAQRRLHSARAIPMIQSQPSSMSGLVCLHRERRRTSTLRSRPRRPVRRLLRQSRRRTRTPPNKRRPRRIWPM